MFIAINIILILFVLCNLKLGKQEYEFLDEEYEKKKNIEN